MTNKQEEGEVTLTKERYEYYKRRDRMLQCLEEGGVDNWDWYSESLKPYFKEYPEEED
jgi:hypothetical protein